MPTRFNSKRKNYLYGNDREEYKDPNRKGFSNRKRRAKSKVNKKSKCCLKVSESPHCACFAELWWEWKTFVWNKQAKRFFGIEPRQWARILMVFIWSICITCALSIAVAVCWPQISSPQKRRGRYLPANADDFVPRAFKHFPFFYNANIRNLVIDVRAIRDNVTGDVATEIRETVRREGKPMSELGINWMGSSNGNGFRVSMPPFGPCARMTTSNIRNFARAGKMCFYLAPHRFFPSRPESLSFKCFTRVKKGEDSTDWSPTELKFAFNPPSLELPNNFFDFKDIQTVPRDDSNKYTAPGISILVEKMQINRAAKMCPHEFEKAMKLETTVNGGFSAEIGIKAT